MAAIASGKIFHIEFDGVNVTGPIAVPNTGGWQTWATVKAQNIQLSAGNKIMRVVFETNEMNLNFINAIKTNNQTPYNGVIINLPGKVEAENYDLGGQGEAFNETTPGNTGAVYRNDAVDIEACTDAGGGFNLGWIDAGEWLEYTVNATATSNYRFNFRVATPMAGKTLSLLVDGVNRGTVNIPVTGGWQNWATVSLNNITLNQGQHIIRLLMNGNEFNVNYFDAAVITPKTGMFDQSAAAIRIYPNPANELLFIESAIEGMVTLAIFDSFGQEILKKENISGNFSEAIEFKSLLPGIYMVRIVAGEEIFTERIVKQ
ncbi:MAG: carbohydrate-binding protein [Cytophagaceae bacterium]|nr:carbohydrate-binding protein [Cytophagaceae bacterium]